MRAASISQEQIYAEEQAQADAELPPETAAALQDAHDLYIGKAKAQGAYAQRLTDAAYESAAQAAEPPQLFVKRGGEMGRTERSRLKPGEPVFAKFGGGDWQVVGHVNANGEAPEPPLIP